MKRQSDKITALYCRLAHYDGELDILAGQNQQDTLLKYAAEHGLENPQLFCDWGFSGTTDHRPEFQHMLREIKTENVSSLVVKNLSRLGRNSRACGKLLETVLTKYNVTLHSVQDGLLPRESLAEHAQMMKSVLSLSRQSRRGGRS